MSAHLLNARREAKALSEFPGTLPADLVSAYEIQSYSIERWPDKVAGWKVGGIPPQWRERLGADWLVGPIFSRSVKTGESASMPVFENGFAAIEPELIIQLGASRAQDRIFTGAEIASSPVPAINDYGPIAVVCDFGNNNGVLIGQEIVGWSDFDRPLEVSIWIDGALIGRKVLEDVFAAAFTARDFCIENAKQRGIELQPGTLISSGAITGVHEAKVGAHSIISFGPLGKIELDLGCAAPLDQTKE
ncbi:2-keto-4-pentenoate hydratase [Erythrobacter insulae]|uniref:2-keto-4-pentenoate hydratase n=1 Tax=Erythrobacter insulae TaxID=2584124 RepID=A0A547PD73_9SPHN|nr:2-keto-4-pentenoate hydratase [Erythrobacter insulae]TRD12087.1 2-keto-4-pentenoate hydratase [Erythrobacter insulae]